MNKVILIGNVCNDIDVRKTQSGKSVCEFSLAINESYNGETKAEFVDCQAWEKSADILGQYVSKGNKLMVEGKIRSNVFTDAKGEKRKKTVVLLTNFEFLTPKADGTHEDCVQTPRKATYSVTDANSGASVTPSLDINSDELPFY